MKVPCNGCPYRHFGCHSVCLQYKTFQTERQTVYELRRMANNLQNDLYQVHAKRAEPYL